MFLSPLPEIHCNSYQNRAEPKDKADGCCVLSLFRHPELELHKNPSPWWYSNRFSPDSSGHPRWASTSHWCYRNPWETPSLSSNYHKLHAFLEEHIREPEDRARENTRNWYYVKHLNASSAILFHRNATVVRDTMQDTPCPPHKLFALVRQKHWCLIVKRNESGIY